MATLIRVHKIREDGQIEAHTEPYQHYPRMAEDGEFYLEGYDNPVSLRIPEGHTWEIPDSGSIITLLVTTWAGVFGEADPELGHSAEDVAEMTARYLLRLLPEEVGARMEERARSFDRFWKVLAARSDGPLFSDNVEEFLGYEVSDQGELLGAPCACNECRDGQLGMLSEYGQGHFMCSCIPKDLLAAEELGLVSAHYQDSWVWHVNQNTNSARVAGLALDAHYDLLRLVNLFLRDKMGFADLRKAAHDPPHPSMRG